jgi:hypothetical protein
MQAIWSSEDIVGSDHSDDRIEKLPSFVNYVRKPFVMGFGPRVLTNAKQGDRRVTSKGASRPGPIFGDVGESAVIGASITRLCPANENSPDL